MEVKIPLVLFLALVFLLNLAFGQNEPPPPIPIKLHDDHRPIQWCVNGIDEPEFHQYPYSEFKPFIQRRHTDHFKANVRFRYNIDLRPIKIKAADNVSIGAGGNLYQRAHFVFKAEIRREFKYSVDTYYSPTEIEGLLLQANYAPLGVGLPTGSFVHPKDFNCVDCRKPIGIPIPCKKRTHMHVVHPQLLAYHFQAKVPQVERVRRVSQCIDARIPSQCIVKDFTPQTVDNSTGPLVTPTTTPAPGVPEWPPAWTWPDTLKHWPLADTFGACVPGPGAEDQCFDHFKQWYERMCCPFKDGIWCDDGSKQTPPVAPWHKMHKNCPNVRGHYDLRNEVTDQSIMLFECKPLVVQVCRPSAYAENAPYPWETERDLKTDFTNREPPVPVNRFDKGTQCCNPPVAGQPCPPTPPGQSPVGRNPCPQASATIYPTECINRVVLPYNEKEDEEAEEPDLAPCHALQTQQYYGRTSEVHGNFVWHLPPCHLSSRVRFLMMVVHSFQKGIYSVLESEDYFDLKAGVDNANHGKLNPYIPSPLFYGFPHTCESHVNQPDYLFSRTFQDTPFDYSRSYDECIQKTGDNIQDQVCEGVPKFVPYIRTSKGNKKPNLGNNTTDLIPRCDKRVPNIFAKCESVCPGLSLSTEVPTSTAKPGFIKRTPHGAINIVTNFCIMPICIFVARFYKETYNYQSYKGQKLWFWMHMVGAGGSTIFQYIGFFSKQLTRELSEHIVLGNIYILCLGLSYVTAWIRHKRRLISSLVEIIHSGCGYGCFFLALKCINNATQNDEPINPAIKIVVYVASASLTVFYVGMTIHICSMDRKFGMKPARYHFPTVEAKFDDLPVPGRNVRRFFLILLLWVNLPLTISTFFL